MTISSSLSGLLDGSYISTVQDALGNSGATAKINSDGTFKLTGTPTGAGLRIRAAALSAKTKTSPNKDVISLSARAQAALTNQEIGLKLILAGESDTKSLSTKSDSVESPTTSVAKTPPSSSSTIDTSDVTALAQEDPTQVIHDVIAAGETALASISTTQGVHRCCVS